MWHNGLHYPLVGGRGLCLGAGKLEAGKLPKKATESPASSARFAGTFFGMRSIFVTENHPAFRVLSRTGKALATFSKLFRISGKNVWSRSSLKLSVFP